MCAVLEALVGLQEAQDEGRESGHREAELAAALGEEQDHQSKARSGDGEAHYLLATFARLTLFPGRSAVGLVRVLHETMLAGSVGGGCAGELEGEVGLEDAAEFEEVADLVVGLGAAF